MAGSDSAIKRRLANLAIGQSKLHSQTHRVHMCTPINAATQRPGEAQLWKRIISRRVGSFETARQELQVALDAPEIYVLGLLSRHGEVEIVWHTALLARAFLSRLRLSPRAKCDRSQRMPR